PEKEGWELSLVLANARRAAKLSGQAGDQRGRISAQILLARVVWASLGHADVEAGRTPAAGTVSGSASAPSAPGAAARSAWYDRITTSEEVSGLLEASRAEAGENGLPGLVAEAALWQERFFEKSPGLYATGWEMSKRPRPVPFEESGLGRGDRCAVCPGVRGPARGCAALGPGARRPGREPRTPLGGRRGRWHVPPQVGGRGRRRVGFRPCGRAVRPCAHRRPLPGAGLAGRGSGGTLRSSSSRGPVAAAHRPPGAGERLLGPGSPERGGLGPGARTPASGAGTGHVMNL